MIAVNQQTAIGVNQGQTLPLDSRIQHVEVPEGVQVIVRDYDVDGTEEDQLERDENGNHFIESNWEHE